MRANHKHYILLILATAALAVSTGAYIILYRTIMAEARESSKVLAELTKEDEKKRYEQELSNLYAKSSDDRASIESHVASQEKIVNFIEYVEGIGGMAGVKIALSALNNEAPPEAKTSVGHVKGHIEAEGSWTNIMRALILIENMPYASSLNNLRFRENAGPSSKVRVWNMSMDIVAIMIK